MQWRKRPIIYEIHTRAWLADLRVRYRQPLTLGDMPAAEWDSLAALHIDAVWFMGVWRRSPRGIVISNANEGQQVEFRGALPDYAIEDNVGSAYCVLDYVVDDNFGGAAGLAQARAELAQRGIRLVLDFVPNHVAADHLWTTEHPEYFIPGTRADLEGMPREYIEAGEHIIANGRDPYFPPWEDVVQVNAFHAGFRAASLVTVNAIAAQCDGMRCDMAMLMLTDIFARTWGERAGAHPELEYWSELISAVKQKFPDVLFIAEAYWNLEYELMQNGFDYCYDKRLYDRLVRDNADAVRSHLLAGIEFQDKLVRFIENHDEPRAAAVFAPMQERAAAMVATTLPGARMLYEGQLDGRKIKTPVFFARRVAETKEYELESFYRALLKTMDADLFHEGEWSLCFRSGWSDNPSHQNIMAWTWQLGSQRALIIVNYAARRSQAMIRMPWDDLGDRMWRLADALNGDVFFRDGNQLNDSGLFVDLDAWRFHFFMFE